MGDCPGSTPVAALYFGM